MLIAMVMLVHFNIPIEGTLSDQMYKFYRQASKEFLWLAGTTELPAQHGVSGLLDPWEALCQLIAGTGVVAYEITDHSYALAQMEEGVDRSVPVRHCPAPPEKPRPLPPLIASVTVAAPRHPHPHMWADPPHTCVCTPVAEDAPWCITERGEMSYEQACRLRPPALHADGP